MKIVYIVSIADVEGRMHSFNIIVPGPPGMEAWNKAIAKAQQMAGVPETSAPQTCQLSHAAIHGEVE